MDRAVYEAMAEDETHHWWFVGRRRVLSGLIEQKAKPPAFSQVLDAGCGSGGNLEMLAGFGQVTGVEYDDIARDMAAERGIAQIQAGALPDDFNVRDDTFELIGLFDVLEHVEQDTASLRTLGRKLTSDGRLVISVPALPWLWSSHDVSHHHFRRYTKASLRKVVEEAGLEFVSIGYFNTLLFPLVLLQRLIQKATGLGGETAARTPAKPLNVALAAIFGFEKHLVGRIPLPIGLSLWAVVRRK